MLEMFKIGFQQILTPLCLGMTFVGVFSGCLFGCIPGLSGVTAFVILLPLTYNMDAVAVFAMIMGIYVGGCSGGMISAILLNIPGTASNVATAFDGAKMARNGEAGKALGTGIFYSFLGGSVSFAVLFLIAGPIARFALSFGPAEYFMTAFFSLTMVAALSGQNLMKGIATALLGMLCSFIGMSEVDGAVRMTFGFKSLMAGIDLMPALIGLYAVGEVINASKSNDVQMKLPSSYKIKGFGFSLQEFKEQFGNFCRSALIGTFIGVLPGIGGMTSNLVSYSLAKTMSKTPEKFGTGYIGGIVAPETANNASVGGALVPMLSLGIPGDTFTAMVLGAMMLHGFVPGPLMMENNGDVVYAIFASLIIANFMTVALQYFGMRGFVRMLAIPKHILMPIIMVLSLIGAFAINNRIFDCWVVLIFGALGIFMLKYNFPLTPIVLGFVLGPIAEKNLRRALMLSRNDWSTFVQRPISLVMLILAIISLLFAPKLVGRENKAAKKMQEEADENDRIALAKKANAE